MLVSLLPFPTAFSIRRNYTHSTFFSSFPAFSSWGLLGVGLEARHGSCFPGGHSIIAISAPRLPKIFPGD